MCFQLLLDFFYGVAMVSAKRAETSKYQLRCRGLWLACLSGCSAHAAHSGHDSPEAPKTYGGMSWPQCYTPLHGPHIQEVSKVLRVAAHVRLSLPSSSMY